MSISGSNSQLFRQTRIWHRCWAALSYPKALSSTMSAIQNKHMMEDMCLVTNEADEVIATASKKECHFKKGRLHRAFSLFLFRQATSQSGQPHLELLLQRRASTKLTFPNLWTNTCCSHPLQNHPGETEEHKTLGVRLAAQRKVKHELGIDSWCLLPLENIHFLTRILYSARNEPPDDIEWIEREIDYLLVSILPASVSGNAASHFLDISPDEVSATAWKSLEAIETAAADAEISPLPNAQSETTGTYNGHHTPWVRGLLRSGLLRRLWQWADARARLDADASSPSLLEAFNRIDESWDRSLIHRLKTD
uniref:isopentenyl-diphosphate Delta-isomerase n=1 Tax=Schistocephalus solidus TaxID=70667 RepID=A0A0X3NK18_SCHSO